jgi:hypothetical protein
MNCESPAKTNHFPRKAAFRKNAKKRGYEGKKGSLNRKCALLT